MIYGKVIVGRHAGISPVSGTWTSNQFWGSHPCLSFLDRILYDIPKWDGTNVNVEHQWTLTSWSLIWSVDHFQSLSALIYRTFQNTNNRKVGAKAGNIPLLVLHNSKYILQTSIQKSKKTSCLEPVDTNIRSGKNCHSMYSRMDPTRRCSQCIPGTLSIFQEGLSFWWLKVKVCLGGWDFNMKNLGAASNFLDKRHDVFWLGLFWPFQQPKLQL